ncbi:MAG: hypothetical protein ACI35O_00370 [Bacillaceae bacterium]
MKIKDLWRWVLSKETNQNLSNLCVGIGATIQGFRNNRVNDQNRRIVIQNLLTPKSMSRLCQKITVDEDGEEIAKENVEQLKARLVTSPPEGILKILLVKGENEKALELFSFVKEQEKESEEFVVQLEESKEENKKEESKIKKIEKKYQKLKKHSDEEILRLRGKITRLQEENERLKQVLQEKQLEKNEWNRLLKKVEEEKEYVEKEKLLYQKQIEEYKKQQVSLQMKLAALGAQEQLEENTNYKTIALIGDPKNEGILDDEKVHIQILDGKDADEIEKMDYFDEVWMLTYKVPIIQQRKMMMHMNQKEIVKIDTFSQLMEKLLAAGVKK